GAERVMATRARFVTSFRTSPSTLSPSIVDQWGSPFNRLSMFVNRGVSFFETLRLPDRLHTVSSFGSDFQQILTIPGSALRLSFPPGTVTLIKGRIPFQVSQPTQPHAFVIERHPPSASPFEPLWDVGPAEVSAYGTWAGPSPTLLMAMYVPMPLVNPKALQGHAVGKWANFYLYTCTRLGRRPCVRDAGTSDVPRNEGNLPPQTGKQTGQDAAWWDDVTDISVHRFGSLEAAFDAFTHDRVTTIDWEDALTFTERLRVGANKSELMAQAKTIAENLLELIRERIDHVGAAERGAIHSSANALVMGLPTRSFPQSPSPPLSMPPLLARWARVGSRSIDQPPGQASTDTPSMQG
ncbi:hypothetical protein FA13DRAFT_1720879, partial [Coprinellus micaceus]